MLAPFLTFFFSRKPQSTLICIKKYFKALQNWLIGFCIIIITNDFKGRESILQLLKLVR